MQNQISLKRIPQNSNLLRLLYSDWLGGCCTWLDSDWLSAVRDWTQKLLSAVWDWTQIDSALYGTGLRLTQRSSGMDSDWLSAVRDWTQIDSALYRTGLRLTQRCTGLDSDWLSAVRVLDSDWLSSVWDWTRVGHRVLFRSERSVLFHSFKERNVLFRSFFGLWNPKECKECNVLLQRT